MIVCDAYYSCTVQLKALADALEMVTLDRESLGMARVIVNGTTAWSAREFIDWLHIRDDWWS